MRGDLNTSLNERLTQSQSNHNELLIECTREKEENPRAHVLIKAMNTSSHMSQGVAEMESGVV